MLDLYLYKSKQFYSFEKEITSNKMNVRMHKEYRLTIIQHSGTHPITGEQTPRLEEVLTIKAENEYEAYKQSAIFTKLKFMGQTKQILIDGKEFLNPKF